MFFKCMIEERSAVEFFLLALDACCSMPLSTMNSFHVLAEIYDIFEDFFTFRAAPVVT
jgi:hypothetical protein